MGVEEVGPPSFLFINSSFPGNRIKNSTFTAKDGFQEEGRLTIF